MQRVTVYIDGFNLYYGLQDRKWQRYHWLDVRRLSENLLHPGQSLVTVRYFTARVHSDPNRPNIQRQQETFLEALGTLPDVSIHLGYYLRKKKTCPKCGDVIWIYEEKMTDVNIASELLGDAHDNVFDTAIIVSADSDLAGPVTTVLRRYPNKRMILAFPPKRVSQRLRQVATANFIIGRRKFAESQLPNQVTKSDGYVLSRPYAWS